MSWIEQQLANLAADGYFDDLPGSGRPIEDLDVQYSPTWWAARWLERDAARQDLVTMRNRLQADVAVAAGLPVDEARDRLASISEAVRGLNRLLDSDQQLPELDVDEVLIRRTWGGQAV